MITGATNVFGIFGRPVAHSLSPAMHNAAFRSLGLNAVYVPFAVPNLDQAVKGLRGLNLGGVSVTIPFKEEIIPLLDEVDERAMRIGAVNTVINREGWLWGGNTDWKGALTALQDQTQVAGQRVLVLGAGGVGRAIVYAVRQAGGEVTVTDLDGAKAQTLAQQFGAEFCSLAEVPHCPAAILINATPLGMAPDLEKIPLPPNDLVNYQIVMDVIYTPRNTRLLREAAARECRIIDGFQMFVYQGAHQFELFTGQPAPVEIMRQAALAVAG